MQPSLAIIQRKTGQLIHQILLSKDRHTNSIRHITISSSNTVYVALQNQSKQQQDEVLLFKYDIDNNQEKIFHIPITLQRQLKGYIGYIALDKSEKYIAASSPKGNSLLFFHKGGQFIHSLSIEDICGIAKTEEDGVFIASTGTGEMNYCSIRPTNDLHKPFSLTSTLYDVFYQFYITLLFDKVRLNL